MAGWLEFALALAFFFASHAAPTHPRIKARLAGLLGARGFTLAYSLLSLAALGWLIGAAGRAPHVEIWAPAPWQRWAPNLMMPAAFLLAALAVGAPNPLSFGGARNHLFDPERPGAAGLARHPLLWALALWAGAHLVPNGDLAHLIVFGLLGGFALLGMGIIDRRKRRLMGEAEWARLARRTSNVPLARLDALQGGASALLFRSVLAALAYLAMLGLHEALFGVSPLPL